MYFIRLSFFFFVLFLLIQCDEKSTDNVNAVPEKSSDSLKILEEKKKEEISIYYHPEIHVEKPIDGVALHILHRYFYTRREASARIVSGSIVSKGRVG